VRPRSRRLSPDPAPGFGLLHQPPPRSVRAGADAKYPPFAFAFRARRCKAQKGEDDEECEKYAKYYRSICPSEWVTKWNEEREEGTWPGRY
jgi:hypothetical protein